MSDDGPVKASDVAARTEKSEREIRLEKAKAVSQGIVARRAAMRRAAKDPTLLNESSPDLATRLEARLKARDREAVSKYAASRAGIKGAVAAKLGEKR